MAAEFTLLDQLKPCIHILYWPCLGLQRKRRRRSLPYSDERDDREYDPLERQGLLDDEEETIVARSSRTRELADDEDAMSLHSNIGRAKSHRPEHPSPHSPSHKLSRWQLFTSWLDVLRAAPRQPVSLSNHENHGGAAPSPRPADIAGASQQDERADDDERAEIQRLNAAIAKAKSSARKKRLRQARIEAALAERSALQEDIDWGPMQHASSSQSQTISHTRTCRSGQAEITRQFGYQGQDSETEEQEGVPDMAAEGGLFSSSTAKAKRIDHSASGLSSDSLSSSGSSAYGRRDRRERSRRALSDTVSNVTRDNKPASFDK